MSNDPDPVEPSTEIVKAVAAPLSEGGKALIARVFGPAADELGAYLRDRATLWRAARTVYTIDRAAEMIEAAGLEPKPVPPKALVNIVEGASLEDEPSLTEMWAALLANASASDAAAVAPSLAAILRQLSPTDALVFIAVAASSPRGLNLSASVSDRWGLPGNSSDEQQRILALLSPEETSLLGVPGEVLSVATDNLIRLGVVVDASTDFVDFPSPSDEFGPSPIKSVIRSAVDVRPLPYHFPAWTDPNGFEIPSPARRDVRMSSLGIAFYRACTPPTAQNDQAEPRR